MSVYQTGGTPLTQMSLRYTRGGSPLWFSALEGAEWSRQVDKLEKTHENE